MSFMNSLNFLLIALEVCIWFDTSSLDCRCILSSPPNIKTPSILLIFISNIFLKKDKVPRGAYTLSNVNSITSIVPLIRMNLPPSPSGHMSVQKQLYYKSRWQPPFMIRFVWWEKYFVKPIFLNFSCSLLFKCVYCEYTICAFSYLILCYFVIFF